MIMKKELLEKGINKVFKKDLFIDSINENNILGHFYMPVELLDYFKELRQKNISYEDIINHSSGLYSISFSYSYDSLFIQYFLNFKNKQINITSDMIHPHIIGIIISKCNT
jgi:hypothetical protein